MTKKKTDETTKPVRSNEEQAVVDKAVHYAKHNICKVCCELEKKGIDFSFGCSIDGKEFNPDEYHSNEKNAKAGAEGPPDEEEQDDDTINPPPPPA